MRESKSVDVSEGMRVSEIAGCECECEGVRV